MVSVGVGVTLAVFVGVIVAVAVLEGVRLGVMVGVDVDVAVIVGPAWIVTTSCGAAVPSRDENVMPSLLSAIRANVKVPFPLTKVVTSYSTQEPAAIAPALSTAVLNRAGRVFQVMPPVPDSIQLLSARWTAGPFVVPLVLQYTRSVALWMEPLIPFVLKRM